MSFIKNIEPPNAPNQPNVPIPTRVFSSNSLTIDKKTNDNIKKNLKQNKIDDSNYDFEGTYRVSCSSNTKGNEPFNVFNSKNQYWQCDYRGNKNVSGYTPYTTDPYSNSNYPNINSTYQGGGNNSNYWRTTIYNEKKIVPISGEWIQIQLPKRVYLNKYRISTPSPNKGIYTFPTKFMILGSNDGKSWSYVDYHNIDTTNQTMKQSYNTFEIVTTNRYSYYRLIIMEMPPGNSVVRITSWSLYYSTSTMYSNLMKENFTNLYSSTFSDKITNYSNYEISKPLELYKLKTQIDNTDYSFEMYNDMNDNFAKKYHSNIDTMENIFQKEQFIPLIFVSILAISIVFHYK
jgi:hypothetical protein